MNAIVFSLPCSTALAATVAARLHAELGTLTVHSFPDQETYIRIDTPVTGREVVLVCTLDRPDAKFLPLAYTAATAKQLGATRVGLIAPYLGYMRQDKRFKDGEAITSEIFAGLLSRTVDWIVTVDPHLHRHHALNDIYSIPGHVVHAAPMLAEWIKTHVTAPLLIGPDSESAQWVAAVAAAANMPYLVLEKIRYGDRDVRICVPQVARWLAHTPVLVDDIISTAHTMIETVIHLKRAGLQAPVCVGVHAVMAGSAYEELLAVGAAAVVTCNAIAHASNGIDVTPLIAKAVQSLLSLQ